jgi:serine phosphatase RsbU (regulator of sigma subunit)
VESQATDTGDASLPRRREDLADLAVFMLDAEGDVTDWPDSAARLFGVEASEAIARHICDVLLTGPGHRRLAERALAEISQESSWTCTVAGGRLGDGRFAFRWEPLSLGAAVVSAWRAWPQPASGWLTEAAARIGAVLDLTQTADEVARTAVPAFCDVAVVFAVERMLAEGAPMASPPGSGVVVRRLAARLADYGEVTTNMVLPVGEVVSVGPDSHVAQAITTGKPIMFDSLDGHSAERLTRRAGGTEVISGYSSFLAMPLIARDTVIGCMMFARDAASAEFTPYEVGLASELASRAAVCIDNARLYHGQQRTALALQRGLLPGRPDLPEGLEAIGRYEPAGTSVIGGDWHDIVPLPGGQTALIVGDAMGHGPEAAAAMVQLRTAAHALADLLPPGQLLSRLDRIAERIATAPFATCVAAVIDPAAKSCTVAVAGHVPPFLVLPGGVTQMPALPSGLPLGLGVTEPFDETVLELPPGATLVLYTDGVVEDRTSAIDEGISRLRAALGSSLSQPDAPLAGACQAVIRPGRQLHEDDATLVLARVHQ